MRRTVGTLMVGWIGLGVAHATCTDDYYQDAVPQVINKAMAQKARELCFDGFAVMHSGITRSALWSAEHLTAARLQQAQSLDRKDSFHTEAGLPDDERATLADYSGSGFDRGHMSPNGDMADRSQQSDSFSLANMVPQSPHNNREVWRGVEEATRALTKREGEAWVVTGPAYIGKSLQKAGNVLIPTHVWKAVYYPSRSAASAYFAPNDESGQITVISVADLENKIGINVMPTVSQAVKIRRIDLPTTVGLVSVTQTHSAGREPPPAKPASANWLRLVIDALSK